MQGLMQDWPLTVDKILDHARTWHGDREVVTRSVEGPIVRTSYAALHGRAKQTSNALLRLGITLGDRVATLAWCTGRHMEAWYGIMGIGAICHTLNPRLHPQQLAWMINHAGDRLIFVDLTFLPLIEAILPSCPALERVIVLTDGDHLPAFTPRGETASAFRGVVDFEAFIAGQSTDCAWGGFEENTAGGLCYTSGTTGEPKGVLYSHRSNFLHTLATLQTDVMGVSARDTVLAVVPMFHANGWGLAFGGPASGAKLVMPGAKLDGASLYELIETEQVTFTAAVPTVWQGLLQYLGETGAKFTSLKSVLIGGAAVSESTIAAFRDDYGVEVVHAWGMTETSPLGTVSQPTAAVAAMSPEAQLRYQLKQGRPPLGIELRVTSAEGGEQPHDGRTFGHLKVRGPFVASAYFRSGEPILDAEGFFDTGDIATLDAEGYMQITDRSKDLIKSGGEWISSQEIENLAQSYPKTALAAVIGRPHPKWDERPLLIVKLKPGETATPEEYLAVLDGEIAKWWMPDDVVFVDDIPLGATGKIDKKPLRERFADYAFPAAPPALPERAAPSPVLVTSEPVALEAEPDPEPELTTEHFVEPSAEVSEVAADPVHETEPGYGAAVHDPAIPEPHTEPAADLFEPSVGASAAEATNARREAWLQIALNVIVGLTLLPAVLAAIGAIGARAGLFSWAVGYQVITGAWAPRAAMLGLAAAVVGGGLALGHDRRLWRLAIAAFAIAIATLLAIIGLQTYAARHPAYDIATDWREPLSFADRTLAERGDAATPVDLDPMLPVGSGPYAGRRIAEVNAETCRGAQPAAIAGSTADAYAAARRALAGAGVSLAFDDPTSGRLEGPAVSPLYGARDDVTVRVRSVAGGARVDMRSTAREPGSDMGRNCRRVAQVMAALKP